MKSVTIPADLFVMGEFYPFSGPNKQALPFWYAGHFFGMVFQNMNYHPAQKIWRDIQARSEVNPGEICYGLEFTRVEHAPNQKRRPTPYHFASRQEVRAAQEKAGLMGPAYLMFALQEILQKHAAHYKADRYFFLVFSEEIANLYHFLIRTGMTYPYRHYEVIHHPAPSDAVDQYEYFEVRKREYSARR